MNQSGNGRMIRRPPAVQNGLPNGSPVSETPAAGLLYRMRLKEICAFVLNQKFSFWTLTLYMFMEYVRPQQIYRQIDILPWAQIFLILTVLFMLLEGKRFRPWYSVDTAFVVFLVMILLSIPFAWRPAMSMPLLFVPFSWFLVYYLITNIVDSIERFFVFTLSFLLYSVKMAQHGARGFLETGGQFREWGATGAPGWFQNSGEFAIQMCIFFSMSLMFFLVLRKNWGKVKQLVFLSFPMMAVISVVASSSRGGQLALGGGIGWLMMKSLMTKHRGKAVGAAVLVAICAAILIPPEQWTRFSEMGTDQTSTTRITYWKHGLEIMRKYPVLGIGYENWIPYYMVNISRDVQLPHNIFIQAAAELGYPGLFAFLLLIYLTVTTNYRTRKLARQLPDGGRFITAMAHGLDSALMGYLIAGFFVTVLYYPFFWINLAFTVSLYHTTTLELRRQGAMPAVPVKANAAAAPPRGMYGRVPQRIGRGR